MYRYLLNSKEGYRVVTAQEFRAAGGNPRKEKRRHWAAVRNWLRDQGLPVPKGRNSRADFCVD